MDAVSRAKSSGRRWRLRGRWSRVFEDYTGLDDDDDDNDDDDDDDDDDSNDNNQAMSFLGIAREQQLDILKTVCLLMLLL